MRCVAIIPARGGSRGLPRKNILPLCGKPLIAWSIEQALASELVSEVYVTTDSDEIIDAASECGASVIIRPSELATDTCKTEAAVSHALAVIATTGEMVARMGDGGLLPAKPQEPIDLIVLLQPTSPIRQPHDIDNAIRTLIDQNADSLFSARHVEGFTWTQGLGRAWIPSYQHTNRPRRQDLQSRVEENGSIYVFKPSVLKEYGSRLGGDVACYLMHPLDSFQVDCAEDLELMESLLPMRLPPVKPHFTTDVNAWEVAHSGYKNTTITIPPNRC